MSTRVVVDHAPVQVPNVSSMRYLVVVSAVNHGAVYVSVFSVFDVMVTNPAATTFLPVPPMIRRRAPAH